MRTTTAALGAVLACAVLASAHPATAADPVIVRVGTVAPEGTPWERQVKRTRKRVEKATDKKVQLKVYLGGRKGDEKSLVRQCRDARLEMVGVSVGALATAVPDLQVIELPFLFESTEEADYVLDRHLFEPVKEMLAAHGFVLAQWAENGWQGFGMREGFVTSPKDLVGRKMRSQESPVHISAWRAFGASPVEMAVSEVLPALKTGLVEGFGQTPLFTFAAGWHQGIGAYTVSRHVYQPAVLAYSKKWFDAQPKDVQAVLLDARDEETRAGRDDVRKIEPGLIANFVNYGIKVHELTAEERQSFAQAAKKMHQEFLATATPGGKKLYEIIARGKAEFRKSARK